MHDVAQVQEEEVMDAQNNATATSTSKRKKSNNLVQKVVVLSKPLMWTC